MPRKLLGAMGVRPMTNAKLARRLTSEWVDRTEKLRRQMVVMACKSVLAGVRLRIPKKPEYKDYKQALDIARVTGILPDETAYCVRINTKNRKIRKVKQNTSVLYVVPRRKMRKVDEVSVILAKYNPWTLDTLPVFPKPADAKVKTVKVGLHKFNRFRRRILRMKPKWRKELVSKGVREKKEGKKFKDSWRKTRKPMPNIVIEVLKLEFGLEVKPKPHWKPAILRFLSLGLRSMKRRNPDLLYSLTKVRFRSWRKWPTKVRAVVRRNEVRGYLLFQKKLGIKVSGG